MTEIIKDGYLSVKEEGLRAWIWSKRFCVLRDQALTFHRNEQSGQCVALIFLKEINSVTRTELKPYCFEIAVKDKTYYIACKNDDELYSWMDEIYNRSPLGVSGPTNFVHQMHVGFDPHTGAFTGMPDQWTKLLKGSAITAEDAAKNPQAVLDVLEFYTEQTKREAEEYGSSHLQGAVERRSDDRWAALLQESKKSAASAAGRVPPPRPPPPPPMAGGLPDVDVNEMMDELNIRNNPSTHHHQAPPSKLAPVSRDDRAPPSPGLYPHSPRDPSVSPRINLPVHDQNHPNLMALLNQEEILMLNVKNVNVVSVNDKEENARESVKDNYNVNVNAKRSVKENVSVKESVKERFVKENVKKQHNKFQHPKRKWNSVSAQ